MIFVVGGLNFIETINKFFSKMVLSGASVYFTGQSVADSNEEPLSVIQGGE